MRSPFDAIAFGRRILQAADAVVADSRARSSRPSDWVWVQEGDIFEIGEFTGRAMLPMRIKSRNADAKVVIRKRLGDML